MALKPRCSIMFCTKPVTTYVYYGDGSQGKYCKTHLTDARYISIRTVEPAHKIVRESAI
jgi:hypothetical protein